MGVRSFVTMKATGIIVFLVGFAAFFSAAESSNLLKFLSRKEDVNIQKVINLVAQPNVLERNQPMEFFWKWGMDPNKRLSSFSWKDCGNASSTVKVIDLKVTPDPVVLPGVINVAFNMSIAKDYADGISGDVVIKKKVGPIHIEIPCIDNIGSCHYDDVCALMAQIPQCPDPLTQHKIPCKCPFKKGNYFLPSSEFSISSDPIPRGDYTLQLNLSQKGAFMGCLALELSVTDGLE